MTGYFWARDYYYYPADFSVRVVNALIGLIESAFVVRIILRLLGANPNAQFVAWVYDLTDRLLGPFAGALPTIAIGGTFVIELSVILAMVGYSILGRIVIRLLHFVFLSPPLFAERSGVPLKGL